MSSDTETFDAPDAGLRDLLVVSLANRYGPLDPDTGGGDSPRGDWNTVIAEVVLPIVRRAYDTDRESSAAELRELRGAIELLVERYDRPWGRVPPKELRAVLNDPATAVRGVKADGWDDAIRWAKHNRDANQRDVLDRLFNPYRDDDNGEGQ